MLIIDNKKTLFLCSCNFLKQFNDIKSQMRLKLHRLFQQHHRNFQTFSRIQNYSIRQNKLKELEFNFRVFELQCVKIQASSIWPAQHSTLESLFNEPPNQQNFAAVLLEGLLNHFLNESVKLQQKVQQLQNITFSHENLKKKHNPYALREIGFFTNKIIKQKIDMKPFIQ